MHTRSILKAISYRIIGTLGTILITFSITGKLNLAFSIGLFDLALKIILYYLHERLWDKVKL